ncbi:MAG: hypothetical protein ABNO52_00355 [Candidatus Shikimatogenerans sp. Tser]|uniref:Uncharacterized protein n=1 Tax=Candidatus Shikimatogenerans sp. Tser TaxID=3158568 RepID=A0AAU7QSD7_9FLAO
MSKKNNNFLSIENIIKNKNLKMNFMQIRFFLLYNNYKKYLNYNINKIKESNNIFNKIKDMYFFLRKKNFFYKKKKKINIIL